MLIIEDYKLLLEWRKDRHKSPHLQIFLTETDKIIRNIKKIEWMRSHTNQLLLSLYFLTLSSSITPLQFKP